MSCPRWESCVFVRVLQQGCFPDRISEVVDDIITEPPPPSLPTTTPAGDIVLIRNAGDNITTTSDRDPPARCASDRDPPSRNAAR